jgi:hypothetical protein
MNFRISELTNGSLFPLRHPSLAEGMPERCSPARIRFAALTRVLACSAPFRQISTCDGRLRREHLPGLWLLSVVDKKNVDSAGLLMEVADHPDGIRIPASLQRRSGHFRFGNYGGVDQPILGAKVGEIARV